MSLLARLNHTASPSTTPLRQRLDQPAPLSAPIRPTAFRLQLARRSHTTPLADRLQRGVSTPRYD